MSREAELYKDKIEVSLDGRQIFYLFFGGAVIVGLVFVLGVMVGRRVEARGHTDKARVAATVDPLAALDRLEGGSGLSFQGALRGAQGPVSDVEKAIQEKSQQKTQQKGLGPQASGQKEANSVDAKLADTKVEPKGDDNKGEPVTKPDAAKAEPAKKNETKKADAKVEAKQDEPKEVAKKDEPKDVAKNAEPKADAKKDEAKKEEGKSKFTLQLSAFQDKRDAQAYLDSIKSAGYQAHITEGAVDGKQYYRVRLGSYRSLDAANEAKAELEKAIKKSAVVMKL